MGFSWLYEFTGAFVDDPHLMERLRRMESACAAARRELEEARAQGGIPLAEYDELSSRLGVVTAWVQASLRTGEPIQPE